jgi:hypothetical protein
VESVRILGTRIRREHSRKGINKLIMERGVLRKDEKILQSRKRGELIL